MINKYGWSKPSAKVSKRQFLLHDWDLIEEIIDQSVYLLHIEAGTLESRHENKLFGYHKRSKVSQKTRDIIDQAMERFSNTLRNLGNG